MVKRRKIETPVIINNPRVIIYDDENIQYVVGNMATFEWKPEYMSMEGVDGARTTFDMGVTITLDIDDANCLENIKLDDTLMKRIAVYNKEAQCKRLDDEIRSKRKRIDEIETILEDRERRLIKLKEFVRHIYEIDIDGDDWDD